MDHRDTETVVGEYWKGIAEGRLLLRRCQVCRIVLHPRRLRCPDCLDGELEWEQSVGSGRIYSFTVLENWAPTDELRAALPYCLGIVHLDEGLHFFTRIHSDDIDSVHIGQRVHLSIRRNEVGALVPAFTTDEVPAGPPGPS